MNVINITNDDKKVSELLEVVSEEGLILQAENGQQFLLIAMDEWIGFDVGDDDDFGREAELTGNNKQLMNLLAERRQSSDKISLADVKRELDFD